MERTEYANGAVRVCGSGAIYRVLNYLGGYLLGAQGVIDAPPRRPSSWWEDMDIGGAGERGNVRFEQAEFWGGSEKAPEPARVARMAEKPAEPAAPPPARAAKARPRFRSEAAVHVYAEKKKNRSIMRIAKFLNISDSLYDGRDRGRWYDLPLRRGQVPYQLTNEVSSANLEGRTLRSVPRVFSGISRPRENGYLMK